MPCRDAEEPKYTLKEARDLLNRAECLRWGHDYEFITLGLSVDPLKMFCSRCGDTWKVTKIT